MNCNVRSVAKISEELATEIGVSLIDNNGNHVVSLQLAQELEAGEFSVIPADLPEGILPLNPKKPIVRPRPTN